MTTIEHSMRTNEKDSETDRVKSDTIETQFEMELFNYSIKNMEQSQFMSSSSVFDDDQAADEEKNYSQAVFYELNFQDVALEN